jgi:hypothetical protein
VNKRREVVYRTLAGDWAGFVEQDYCTFIPRFATEREALDAARQIPTSAVTRGGA